MLSDDELRKLREQCTRFVQGHGPVRPADMLATIPPDTEVDRYGDGGVVADLEREIAELLGKPAAVFLPSGTMAQQSTLRVHAERTGRRVVAFHPTCHLDLHEGRAYERLHGLIGRPVGDANRLMTIDDLKSVAEYLAVLLLELPQREIGGQLPPLDEVRAQTELAKQHGTATHLDGARIWEAAAAYDVPIADIAALFDSVYVSFYKGIGALPGCCVAGDEDLVAEVREWRRRMGGTLFNLWPNAASARTLLAQRLPRMRGYFQHALAIAEQIHLIDGVRVIPDPPQTSMMHLQLRTTKQRIDETVVHFAEEKGIGVWPRAMPSVDPDIQRIELSVGDATMELTPAEVAEIVAQYVS